MKNSKEGILFRIKYVILRAIFKKNYHFMDKLSYALGMNIGRQFAEMGVENFSATDFAQAVADVLEGREHALSPAEAQQQLELFIKSQEAKEAKKGEAARKAGEDFLAENAKHEGVKVTESGLQYMVLEAGLGKHPSATDNVKCHYEGRLIDGTVFDSSYKRGKSASFKPTQVIKGWSQALTMMPEGSVWELYIPYDLAYGERGNQNIPGYSTLIFKVEIIKVK